VGGRVSVAVAPGSVTSAAMRLRRESLADPPVLLALPDLEPPPATATGCPVVTEPPAPASWRQAGG
jgi:AraC family transcriptional regulator